MYYSKIRCNVEKSLEKLNTYKASEMIGVDYSAIITITDSGKIQIDGSQNYNDEPDIENNLVLKIISENLDGLYKAENGILFKNSYENDTYDSIFAPIRHFKNYYVFTFMCKKNGNLGEREVRIAEVLTSAIYENVLLDYEIIKERNYLQNIFDSTKSYIITLDLNESVIAINKKVALISDDSENFIGKNISSFFKGNDYKRYSGIYNKVIKENKSISGEEEFVFKNGKKYYINYTLSPMVDKDNDIIGVVALGIDVTKQKIYEKEIEQLRQYALLGEISAGVAHDIKNPLMSIRGCARLLQKATDNEEMLNHITPIVTEVDRINRIVEQMLSYSKLSIENGFKFVDINVIVDKCIDAISFHKQFKYIEILKEYADDLPYVEGSDIRIQQALMNILLNAIQAIENEGTIKIKTENLSADEKIRIKISDDGIGIEEDVKEKIFEPFYTTKPQGTGLGLSIVSNVMNELGGTYTIDSKPGRGSIINLYIPYNSSGR